MFVNQEGLDASEFLPEDVATYGILSEEGLTAEGFDTIATEEFRSNFTDTFGGIEKKFLNSPRMNS